MQQKMQHAQKKAHHIDLIEADESLEQAQVRLCQLIACNVALLPQNLLTPVQGSKQLPAANSKRLNPADLFSGNEERRLSGLLLKTAGLS